MNSHLNVKDKNLLPILAITILKSSIDNYDHSLANISTIFSHHNKWQNLHTKYYLFISNTHINWSAEL